MEESALHALHLLVLKKDTLYVHPITAVIDKFWSKVEHVKLVNHLLLQIQLVKFASNKSNSPNSPNSPKP